jgi:hypothetical protein
MRQVVEGQHRRLDGGVFARPARIASLTFTDSGVAPAAAAAEASFPFASPPSPFRSPAATFCSKASISAFTSMRRIAGTLVSTFQGLAQFARIEIGADPGGMPPPERDRHRHKPPSR